MANEPKRATQIFTTQGADEKRQGGVHISTVTASRSQQRSDVNERVASVSSLTAEQGNAVRRPFAVFDIDGTLIRWQLYHAVVDRLAKKKLLGPEAKNQLHEARMKWKTREHSESFKEYEGKLIAVYEEAIKDLDTSVFDKTAEEIASEYKEQVYVYTRDLAVKLKARSYVLLAISGSHHELVEHIARLYGFDDWIGTRYERKDSHFTGKKFVGSQDKKTVLSQLIKKHDLTLEGSVAVGDSASDAPMLEMVEQPIAFNPDRTLVNIAREKNWQIVVERKNVIYELGDVASNNPSVDILV